MSRRQPECIHLRPVKCDQCGQYEYLKIAGSNNLAAYTCPRCRTGRPQDSQKTLYGRGG